VAGITELEVSEVVALPLESRILQVLPPDRPRLRRGASQREERQAQYRLHNL
jgi:hypothetical protein